MTKNKRSILMMGMPVGVALLLLLAFFFALPGGVVAAPDAPTAVEGFGPTDLFFSEYIEGSSNNKALEIYNGTNLDITFTGQYTVALYPNGATTPSYVQTLTGVVAKGDVYVIANASAVQTILDQADIIEGAYPNGVAFFNGNDAVALYKDGTLIDVLGVIGDAAYWGSDVTLVRKDAIVSGSDPFAIAEWDSYAQNTFDYLGSHLVTVCGIGSGTSTDLTIDKIGPTEIIAGEDLVYEITVSNLNIDPATNVIVTDTLPISTTYVSDSSGTSVTNPSSGVYVWDFGSVISNTQVTFNLTVTVDAAVPYGTILTNLVTVSTTAAGDDPANNTDEVQTTVIPDPTCGNPATRIHIIQGNGMASPEDGKTHAIEGVVVGDFQTSASLRGFFVQEDDANVDDDPMTSEGIFVYDGSSPAVDVSEGQVVRVVGTVDEYNGLTELTSVSSVEVCSTSGIASAATPTLPVANISDWEWTEGMLVNLTQTLYATENYNQGRYGEVALSVNARLDTPTNVVEPGQDAIDLMDLNLRSQIQMDDGRTTSNPVPPAYIGEGGTLRNGDTLPGLTGVLNYSFGAYEIHPTEAVTFTRVNAREATAPDVGGTHKVASFNVLNYFSTIDTGAWICGPSENMECRGADNADEFTRQRDKIISAIVNMDADVVGLMEIENNVTDAAVQDLVDGLNTQAGAGTYAYIDTGVIGTDAIKVALLYKPATVTPVGNYAILDSSVDPTFIDTLNRPALAQTFMGNTSDELFTVAVNHLKSKGSACDGDPDTGDGQGNCNLTRTAAATALVNWLATDPTSSGESAYLIIGDLNSYAMEDPIDAIKAAGYTDLLQTLMHPYSYVYMGEAGYLDQALANPALAAKVSGVAVWHINADEPSALDYNDYNFPLGLYQPDRYRASDHDPVIVGLDLRWKIYLPLMYQNSGN
ncbi:MAG TPA: endonuclease/exonuclease/phosphatase [Chloroflexi bacterium]|nr:endonuclease/exonuclease/phosphatase [Chloroflexota bacterium]HBY08251.1 endonuclease/exonuclease/phosphatase [Chloroflexota bacterium]